MDKRSVRLSKYLSEEIGAIAGAPFGISAEVNGVGTYDPVQTIEDETLNISEADGAYHALLSEMLRAAFPINNHSDKMLCCGELMHRPRVPTRARLPDEDQRRIHDPLAPARSHVLISGVDS